MSAHNRSILIAVNFLDLVYTVVQLVLVPDFITPVHLYQFSPIVQSQRRCHSVCPPLQFEVAGLGYGSALGDEEVLGFAGPNLSNLFPDSLPLAKTDQFGKGL